MCPGVPASEGSGGMQPDPETGAEPPLQQNRCVNSLETGAASAKGLRLIVDDTAGPENTQQSLKARRFSLGVDGATFQSSRDAEFRKVTLRSLTIVNHATCLPCIYRYYPEI